MAIGTTTTLRSLGAKNHGDIKKFVEGDVIFIEYHDHYFKANLKRFVLENFACPISLVV